MHFGPIVPYAEPVLEEGKKFLRGLPLSRRRMVLVECSGFPQRGLSFAEIFLAAGQRYVDRIVEGTSGGTKRGRGPWARALWPLAPKPSGR